MFKYQVSTTYEYTIQSYLITKSEVVHVCRYHKNTFRMNIHKCPKYWISPKTFQCIEINLN